MSNKPKRIIVSVDTVLEPKTDGWKKLAFIEEGSLWRVWTEFNIDSQKEEILLIEAKEINI